MEERIVRLASLYAVDLLAYAVMSNHYHVVLNVRPELAAQWDAEEVARRWLQSRPRPAIDDEVRALAADVPSVETCRARLGKLSWFMRHVNEPLARMANREDGRTGRFWDGRFRSRVLRDETALLTCVAYVDLNPVRAGLVDDPARSRFTSIARRITGAGGLATFGTGALAGIKVDDYLSVLRWIVESEAGRSEMPPDALNPVLHAGKTSADDWLSEVGSNRLRRRADR